MKRISKVLGWATLEQALKILISGILNLLLARVLFPSDFGTIASISIFVAIGNSISNVGLTTSLIRTSKLTKEDCTNVFWMNLALSMIVYSLLYFGSNVIAKVFNKSELILVIRILGLSIIFNSLYAVQVARMNRFLMFKKLAIIGISSSAIAAVLSISMSRYGYGYWSIIANALTLSLLMFIFSWFLSDWRPSFSFSKSIAISHLKFGYKLTVAGLVDAFTENIASALLASKSTVTTAGHYKQTQTLATIPSLAISKVVSRVSLPLYADAQENNLALMQIHKRIVQVILTLILPFSITTSILAPQIIDFLLPKVWAPIIPYFQFMILFGSLSSLNIAYTQIFNAAGRSDLFLKTALIKKFMLITFLFIGVTFEIWGIIIAFSVSSIMALCINAYYVAKIFGTGKALYLDPVIGPAINTVLYAFGMVLVDKVLMDSFWKVPILVTSSFILFLAINELRTNDGYRLLKSNLPGKS